jgi:alpha-glucuronidase
MLWPYNHALRRTILSALLLGAGIPILRGETGESAWLRYSPTEDSTTRVVYARLPAVIVAPGDSVVLDTAREELLLGFDRMLDRKERRAQALPDEPAILLATADSLNRLLPEIPTPKNLPLDSYILRSVTHHGHEILLITGANDRGVLYGAFAFLRRMALHQSLASINETSSPSAPIRWTNEWDNLDGSVERGYGGRSIFFDNGAVLQDLTRAKEYARLLASIGINGCTINNVNTNPHVLDAAFLHEIARIAAVFRPYGIRISISVDFSSPKNLGALDTFDPLAPEVQQWWQNKADEVYSIIPDLAGFLMKADSEGRAGPSTYGRTHADAANAIAGALAPHGGILVYRAFVYNHHLDWRDPKNDRARAAYDNFAKLDGQFHDNVVVQVKNGPIDFQVREPVSPLIAALHHTNQALELQITQEYTGQQRQLCFLLPMWKQTTGFNLHAGPGATPVSAIVSGKTFHRSLGGFVGVADVGLDQSWMGSDLAQANLYAFGRLAWNPETPSTQIVDEWTRLTFGHDPQVVTTIAGLQLGSWAVYENYTGPLGAGGLTDITGSHYGPGIESSERNGWGQWHRADAQGIGMDRTAATGTGYISQYPPAVARLYESLQTCPDALLLFMHHVSYNYVLHSGETVIQHIYNSHYTGEEEAATYPRRWAELRGKVDEERYGSTLRMLSYQAGYAVVWRDAVCNWFHRESGIADVKGRVGHHPDRIEAEAMTLAGYTPEAVKPWEDASGGEVVVCAPAECTATTVFHGLPGWYEIRTQYFDFKNGASRFAILLNRQQIDQWSADDPVPNGRSVADASTRRTTSGVPLRDGDEIRIIGQPDQRERAMLDYIEIVRLTERAP